MRILRTLAVILAIATVSQASAETDTFGRGLIGAGLGAAAIGANAYKDLQKSQHSTSGRSSSDSGNPLITSRSTQNKVNVNIDLKKTFSSLFSGLTASNNSIPPSRTPDLLPVNPPPTNKAEAAITTPASEREIDPTYKLHENPASEVKNTGTPGLEEDKLDLSILEKRDSEILNDRMGGNRPDGHAAHHIIPATLGRADELRAVMKNLKIDINDKRTVYICQAPAS